MAHDDETRAGGCQCGAVRFEAVGQPKWVAHCHCEDCRRAISSPLATYAGFLKTQVRFPKEAPTGYESSPGVTRTFCSKCGTPISYEGARWPDEIHLFVCAFDDPAAFEPKAHVYVSEQLPWLHLADDLPRHDKTS